MFTCATCGEETNSVWRDAKSERGKGDCNKCHEAKSLREMPPPPLDEMSKSKEGGFEAYREWPHHYIPSKCPYCDGKPKASTLAIDTERDIVMEVVYCEHCKVRFGVCS